MLLRVYDRRTFCGGWRTLVFPSGGWPALEISTALGYPILAAASCGKGGKAEAYMRQQDGIMLSQP